VRLLLIDLQYDFYPAGTLAVAGGDETIPIANALIPSFTTVVATQDCHPRDHKSRISAGDATVGAGWAPAVDARAQRSRVSPRAP
jgi:nicotinamidase-related amidase